MNYLRLILVSLFHMIAASAACRFGSDPSCAFPCNCADPRETCDPDTGACPESRCRQTMPVGYGWGEDGCLVGNVAYAKLATQSGDYTDGYGTHFANRSVDGNTNPRLSDGSCSHTAYRGAPRAWWQVDLGALHVIHNVTIYNRHYGGHRTNQLSILVGGTESGSDFTQCAHLNSQVPDGGHQTFPCSQPLVGRYVKLFKDEGLDDQSNMLNICEVIVTGYKYTDCAFCPSTSSCNNLTGCDACPAGKRLPDCVQNCPVDTYGVNCAHQCNCRDAEEKCDSANGNCSSGCPDWFVGPACNMELAFPDMSRPVYTPAVSTYSHSSVTIQWKKLSSVPDGQYYMYAVEYKKMGGTFLVSTLINHSEGPSVMSTVIGDLDQNTHYIFRIIPSRNISTDEYKNRAQQYGKPTSEVSQITDCPYGIHAGNCCFCRDIEESCAKGTCTSGCQDWFVGETCDTEITSPDMSGPEYTPQLASVTQTSITIKWKMLDSVPDENYYFYQVEFQKNEDGFNTFLIQSHDAKIMDQLTLFDHLESGNRYSFRISPFRNIITDKFNNRKQEFGRNTEILAQNTVSLMTTASPAETTTCCSCVKTVETTPSEYDNTVTIILGVLVGILAMALVAAVVIIIVQYRRLNGSEESSSTQKQSVYYNTANATEVSGRNMQKYNDAMSESGRHSKNLSDHADSGYTTPEPAYSMNQVSEYEDLPPVSTDYETVE